MAKSPTFKCEICGAFHGRSVHNAMCPDCAKKWSAEVDQLLKLVRSLNVDRSGYAAHVRKTTGEIEKKLSKMNDQFKHAP